MIKITDGFQNETKEIQWFYIESFYEKEIKWAVFIQKFSLLNFKRIRVSIVKLTIPKRFIPLFSSSRFFNELKKINRPNKTISDTTSLRKKDFPQKYKSAIIFAPARLFSHLDHFATLSRRFAGIHPYYAFNLAIFFFLPFVHFVRVATFDKRLICSC